MKRFIFILFLIFMPNIAYSQQTGEIDIKKLFDGYYSAIANRDYGNPIIINNAIEIIKHKPNSLETYFVLLFVNNEYINLSNDEIIKRYKDLKQKFLPTITDFKTNPAEKLILLFLIANFIDNNDPELKNSQIYVRDKLLEIKNNIEDLNFLPIVTLALTIDRTKTLDYLNLFKKKFPEHSFIPMVELSTINEVKLGKFDTDYLQQLNNWREKYKNIHSPLNCPLSFESYYFLSLYYHNIGDINSVKKYLNVLEKECPLFHKINKMKDLIDVDIEE